MRWLRAWQRRGGTIFVDAYVRSLAGSGLLPADPGDARVLFHGYLVERALYEVGYELHRGSSSIRAPLRDLPLLIAP